MKYLELKYIVEGEYLGKKFYNKEYIDSKGDRRKYYKPDGIMSNDNENLKSYSIKSLANDKYFEDVLADKGAVAQVAWNLIYSHKPNAKTVELRSSFISSNSWYIRGEFFVTDREHKTRHLAMIRISNHKPEDNKWTQHVNHENIYCVNILIGKDCTSPEIKTYPKTINFHYATARDFYNDTDMLNMLKDLAANNGLTEIHKIKNYYFSKKRKTISASEIRDKAEKGFTKKELFALPTFRDDNPDLRVYKKGLYKSPAGKEYKIYYSKDGKKAFYFDPPHMVRANYRKDIPVTDSYINEAMQTMPICNADTGEYCISHLYSEDKLFQIGCMSFKDIIYQLDIEKFNKFLEMLNNKFHKYFIYDIKKYYQNIETFIQDKDINDIMRKAMIKIGRSLMTGMLKKLNFEKDGSLNVYKKLNVEKDFLDENYYVNWNEWTYKEVKSTDYCDILIYSSVDISDIIWEDTILFAIRDPESHTIFLTDRPKISSFSFGEDEE